MQISDRLKLVAEFVSPCETVADIGTDHGYVPIELIRQGKAKKVFAMDINKGPLERASRHIQEEGLSEQIEVRLSDGLDQLKPKEAQTLVIAGMGGELIVRILNNGKSVLDETRELILSPHSEVFAVREYLVEEGFEIVREDMIKDGGKYYIIMKAIHAKDPEKLKKEYSERSYFVYGKKLIEEENEILYEYLNWKKATFHKLYQSLEWAVSDSALKRKEQIHDELCVIDRTLGLMK